MENTNTPTPLFEIRDLQVRYGDMKVLHGINTDMPAKEVTAILGPSGCGKSTLLRVLNRTLKLTPMARVSGGTVKYHGENLLQHPLGEQQIRKRIGIVQQRPLPFPMSIRDNVMFGADYHNKTSTGKKNEQAQLYLEKVGLWNEVKDRLKSPGSRLSIGQQQRLCIARSLANRPEVLLMDEPCSALDPDSTAKIEDLILKLQEEIAIVIVTHNLAQARRVSSNCLFFLNGTIAEQGKTAEVLNNPVHPSVQAIVMGKEG
jgi:phosphate transport system ATP-binding protein